MLQDHFLQMHMPKVEEEIECMGYQAQQAQLKASQGKMDEAKAHLDNALRSLDVLRREHEYKKWADKAVVLFYNMPADDAVRLLNER